MPSQQTVVITGGSAGVGRATAQAFARRGARIGLVARGKDRLDATVEEVARLGGEAIALPADVADAGALDAAADAVEDRFGPIDVWVNDAMTSVFAPVHTITAEEARRVTEVTYLGYVYGTITALGRMRPRDAGTIVQVGSALAYRGIPMQALYCGAKHAIQGFTESLRCELLSEGSNVRVTMVQLPAVNTPQFDWVRSRLPKKAMPVPPIYQPEVAASAVVWAADHAPRELNVGGRNGLIIALDRLVPWALDLYLARDGGSGQQTDEPRDADEQDSLDGPIDLDVGAHGRFDDEAKAASRALWLNTHGLGPNAIGNAAYDVGRRLLKLLPTP